MDGVSPTTRSTSPNARPRPPAAGRRRARARRTPSGTARGRRRPSGTAAPPGARAATAAAPTGPGRPARPGSARTASTSTPPDTTRPRASKSAARGGVGLELAHRGLVAGDHVLRQEVHRRRVERDDGDRALAPDDYAPTHPAHAVSSAATALIASRSPPWSGIHGQLQRVAGVARDDVHVEVEDGLPGGPPAGLQDVHAVGAEAVGDAAGHRLAPCAHAREVLLGDRVQVRGVRAAGCTAGGRGWRG